ncbi:MAG TPA: PH domain-containing protein [Longimicrobiales bacterium]
MLQEGSATAAAAPAVRSLDPRVIRLWRVRAALWTVALVSAAGAVGWLASGPPAAAIAAAAALAAGALLAGTAPAARYRAWGFQLREHDLYLRRGVLWRSTSVVPHARIQHVDTHCDPLERWLGLASVVVFTAGTTGGAITVPGLASAEAESLRDRLAALGVRETGAEAPGGDPRSRDVDAV